MKANISKCAMLFIALNLLLVSYSMAQSKKDNNQFQHDDVIFTIVPKQPEYIGGLDALYQFIEQNIRYPDSAKNAGVEGKVRIKFVVDKNGFVGEATATTKLGFGLEEEAIRVISSMPRWKPGYNNGWPVSSFFHMPVNFTLPKHIEAATDTTAIKP